MSVQSNSIHSRLQKSERTYRIPLPKEPIAIKRQADHVHTRVQKGRRSKPTLKQKLLVGKYIENRGNAYRAAIEAGYSHNTAVNARKNIIESKGFTELLEEMLPDSDLLDVHKGLLGSTKLDHMTFPLGPAGEDDPNLSGAHPNGPNVLDKAGVPVERTTLSDEEIKVMIAEVGGQVRRIVHGDTARHVYFWAPNDNARQQALKLAYELRGKIGVKDPGGQTPTNLTLNQININDTTPRADELRKTFNDYVKRITLPQQSDVAPEQTS